LWLWRNRWKNPGSILAVYLGAYALMRFVVEFFREPDPQLGLLAFGLTLGQYLSSLFFTACAIFMLLKGRRSRIMIESES
jgi:phosphatidylglycerol:prolipoprotein diacylglycerol transferase